MPKASEPSLSLSLSLESVILSLFNNQSHFDTRDTRNVYFRHLIKIYMVNLESW